LQIVKELSKHDFSETHRIMNKSVTAAQLHLCFKILVQAK